MVSAIRLQINTSGKQLDSNTFWNISHEAELNLNFSGVFPSIRNIANYCLLRAVLTESCKNKYQKVET